MPSRLPASSPLNLLSTRPLVLVAVAFSMGILLGDRTVGLIAATGGAGGGLTAALLTRRAFWRSVGILLTFAALGAWRENLGAGPAADDISRFVGAGYVTVRGTVASDVDVRTYGLDCEIAASRVTLPDGRSYACEGRVAARLRRGAETSALDYGDIVEARGKLERPDSARFPGGFDYAAYLSRRHVFAVLSTHRPADWRTVPAPAAPTDWLSRLADRCRASLLDTLNRLLPPLEASVLAGIMLGARTRLPPQFNDDFTATGTAHILAASGMNVAMIAGLLAGLCRLLRIPRKPSVLVILTALAFYTLMAGAAPSILRAYLMATVFLCGSLLDREGDGPNALATAALILLAVEPGYLLDAGFLLSFAIVAAIFAMMPLFEAIREQRRRVRGPLPNRGAQTAERLLTGAAGALTLTLVSQVASAPLTAQYFNQVSLIGLIANALILPLIAFLLAVGFAVWLCALVWFGGAQFLVATCLSPVLAYLIGTAYACARIPAAVVSASSPGWPLILLYYLAFGLGVWRLRARMEKAAAVPVGAGARA